MNDFLAEYLKRYGLLAVISALVFAVAVWAFAHWAAAPGEKVSVLWGLAVYTKPSEIHGEISTGPITATQFTPSQLPAPSVDDKSRVQLDPIDLEIAHGLSTDSYFQTVESLHSRHALRELRALETNLPIVATPKGSYFFVFNGYLRFNPRIDERSHLLQANVNRFPNNPSAFFEVHHRTGGNFILLAFMSESDANRIRSLPGNRVFEVVIASRVSQSLSSLVELPIERIVSANTREIELDNGDRISVLDAVIH